MRIVPSFVRKMQRDVLKRVVLTGDQALKAAYGSRSPWIQRVLSPGVSAVRGWAALSRQKERGYPVVLLEGQAAGSEQFIRVLCHVDLTYQTFVAWRLFGENPPETRLLGKASITAARQLLHEWGGQADLVVASVDARQSSPSLPGDWLIAPVSVRMVLPLAKGATWEDLLPGMHNQKANMRRARNRGFRVEISRDPADYDTFYERMYLPTANNRHGDHAIILSREAGADLFRRGHLLKLFHPEEGWCGGNICLLDHQVYYLLEVGVLDGRYDLIKLGVVSALYVDAIRRAVQEGYHMVDAGLTAPFLQDSVYRYKRDWGFVPVRNPWENERWLYWAPQSSPAALGWFARNPILPGFARRGGPNLEKVVDSAPAVVPQVGQPGPNE